MADIPAGAVRPLTAAPVTALPASPVRLSSPEPIAADPIYVAAPLAAPIAAPIAAPTGSEGQPPAPYLAWRVRALYLCFFLIAIFYYNSCDFAMPPTTNASGSKTRIGITLFLS